METKGVLFRARIMRGLLSVSKNIRISLWVAFIISLFFSSVNHFLPNAFADKDVGSYPQTFFIKFTKTIDKTVSMW